MCLKSLSYKTGRGAIRQFGTRDEELETAIQAVEEILAGMGAATR